MTELQIIAQKLVERFESVEVDWYGCEHSNLFGNVAKQCALIAIENEINTLKRLNEKWHEPEGAILTSFFDYEVEDLEELRTEIEKL